MKLKKSLLIVLGVLIVLSPTIALAGCYFYTHSVQSEVVSAIIRGYDGEDKECREGEPLFEIFKGMFGSGGENLPTALKALPEEALSYTKYTVLYTDSFDVEASYTYYLSDDSSKCYYTDAENRAYKIAKAGAEAFLNSDYSEKVYTLATPPEVSINGRMLTPYTLDWNYKTVGGVFKKASCCYEDRNESSLLESFLVAFAPEFSLEPDEIHVEVKNKSNGDSIYSGAYKGLSALPVDGSLNVSVDMTAVWKNTGSQAYTGSAKYFFEGRMFGNAVFRLSSLTAKCGEVVILSAHNVIDPSEISIVTEPQLSVNPVFYKVDGGWQALIPLPVDAVDKNTSFSFTVSSASATDILLLNVSPLERKTFTYYTSTSKNFYNETVLGALKANMAPIALEKSSFSFTGGKFVVPTAGNYLSDTSNYPFGTTVRLSGVDGSFTALDHMYCAIQGAKDADGKPGEGKTTTVLAAFDGKVVYVGHQTYTGRLVVIDHGSGLKTWYSNLSSDISVKVGDSVTAGQMIAHAADGGLNSDSNFNFHVGATVNGVPVDIQPLISKGLIASKE